MNGTLKRRIVIPNPDTAVVKTEEVAISCMENHPEALPIEVVAGESVTPTEDGSGGPVPDGAVKMEVGIFRPSKRKEAGGALKRSSRVQHITRQISFSWNSRHRWCLSPRSSPPAVWIFWLVHRQIYQSCGYEATLISSSSYFGRLE